MRAIERAIATAIVFLLLVNVGVLIGRAEEERAAATTTAARHPSAPRFADVDEPYDWRGEQRALEARRRTVVHERNIERIQKRRERRRRQREQAAAQRAEPDPAPTRRRVDLGYAAKVVAACESGRRRGDGTAIVGTHNWRARNPTSTASGAFQFLRGTWRRVAGHIGAGQYPTAAQAPPHLQRAAFEWLYARRGLRPWLASASCWQPMLR